VRYVHRLLGVRLQLVVVDQNYAQFAWYTQRVRARPEYANVTFPGVSYGSAAQAYLMSQVLDANYGKFSIFVAGGFVPRDTSWEGGYRMWPLGSVSQVLRRGATINLEKWAAKTAGMLPRLHFHRPPAEGSWEHTIATNHYLAAYHGRPYSVLQQAYEVPGQPAERERFLLASRLYEQLQTIQLNGSVALPDYVYRNMGVAYSQLIRLEPTAEGQAGAKQRAMKAFIRYLRFETISAVDRDQIEGGILSLVPPPSHHAEPHVSREATGPPRTTAAKEKVLERSGVAAAQQQRTVGVLAEDWPPPSNPSPRKRKKKAKA
jgi:hypothetical protein